VHALRPPLRDGEPDDGVGQDQVDEGQDEEPAVHVVLATPTWATNKGLLLLVLHFFLWASVGLNLAEKENRVACSPHHQSI